MEIINIINLIHGLLVFGLIVSVFINNIQLKQMALSILILTLVQFITNYGRCGLTELEYLFKGEKYKEGFVYRVVKPVITMPEDYFDRYFYLVHVLLIVILWKQLDTN